MSPQMSPLPDMNEPAIELEAFARVLDSLHAGIVFVDRNCAIFHANRAANSMLEDRSPVHAVQGQLHALTSESTSALRQAVAIAAGSPIGRASSAIPLPQADGGPALVHVLPLAAGNDSARSSRHPKAALFITGRTDSTDFSAQAVGAAFDLTAAETRIVGRLLAGRTPAQTAADLKLAMPTVRSHLRSVFAKTCTARQADLVRLASQLAAPVNWPAGGERAAC